MKKVISILITVVLLCGFVLPMLTVHGYNKPLVSVSASPTTVVVGSNVTVTIKHSASDGKFGALDYNISYDSKVLEYVSSEGPAMVNGAGGVLVASWYSATASNEVVTKLVFKSLTAGKSEIKVKTNIAVDENEGTFPTPADGTTTVTVINEQPKSNNANLKYVEVVANDADGAKLTATLSPSFSVGVLSYTVSVPSSTSSVSINSTLEDEKATSKIDGSWGAVAGDWVRKVIVTAEDGVTQKVYSFKIVKEAPPVSSDTSSTTSNPEPTPTPDPEPNPEPTPDPEPTDDLRVIVGDNEYTVVTDTSSVTVPGGFKSEISKYNNIEIPCFVSGDGKVTFVLLSNGETQEFFIYDANLIKFDPCNKVSTETEEFIIFDAAKYTDDVKDYEAKEISVGDNTVLAYKYSSSDEFLLVWAMGDNGTGKLYVYDTIEKTFQRYVKMDTVSEDGTSSDIPVVKDPIDIDDIDFAEIFGNDIIVIVFASLIGIILVLFVAWIAALIRLKRAYPPKAKEASAIPFMDDEDALKEYREFIEQSKAAESQKAEDQENE